MSLTTKQTTNITRALTDENGKPVVTMSGQVTPDMAMSLSLSISDKSKANANAKDVASALDAFVAEWRSMAAANGLPV